jgi:predicted HAD superfamily Cof-like phosphohydrolase
MPNTTHPNSIDLVREFHLAFNHPVAKQLTVGDAKLRRLRVMLIAQELAELAQALGVPLDLKVLPISEYLDHNNNVNSKDVFNGMVRDVQVGAETFCYVDGNVDIIEAADALGDLDYVVQGGNLVFGIPGGLVMSHATLGIHQSNMSKLDAEGKTNLQRRWQGR